jgi:hypothetical protein
VIFENPTYLGKAAAIEQLASASASDRGNAIVALALNETDGEWALERCAEMAKDADANVRRLAAVCLGHLARLHRDLDPSGFAPAFRRLAADPDPDVQEGVQDAADDLRTFLRVRITPTTIESLPEPTEDEISSEADALLAEEGSKPS